MDKAYGFFVSIILHINLFVYEGIRNVYNLMLYIAEMQIVSDKTISSFSTRIYVLLGIFMLFKISFSLVTYVVNPDDFFDKTKGITSIGKNVILSLVLIVLTPYLFQEARVLQTNMLNEHIIENLVFGSSTKTYSTMNESGKVMQFQLFVQWIRPNTDIPGLSLCDDNLYELEKDGTYKTDTKKDEKTKISYVVYVLNDACMQQVSDEFSKKKESSAYNDYVNGLETQNLAWFYNENIFTTRSKDEKKSIIHYNSLFSIISGIIVVFILISFCFDIAVRSIKLGFFQIMAPIPIISLCDPKGKDGMFKKWGSAVIKTYLSLFIRLASLYFSINIINQIIIDPRWHQIESATSFFATAFLIIGALMFAKQLPGILSEITGIKLNDKFTLNPFKRIEEDALGGKRITGALAGGAIGIVGAFTGAGRLSGFTGLISGFAGGKGFSDTLKAQRDKNAKARNAYINHATAFGRLRAGIEEFAGTGGEMARIAAEKQRIKDIIDGEDREIKNIEDQKNQIKGSEAYRNRQEDIERHKRLFDDGSKVKERGIAQVKNGEGTAGAHYNDLMQRASEARANGDGRLAAQLEQEANHYAENEGWREYTHEVSTGGHHDATMDNLLRHVRDSYERVSGGIELAIDATEGDTNFGDAINRVFGAAKGEVGRLEVANRDDEDELNRLERQIAEHNDRKAPYNTQLRDIETRESRAKANSDSRPFQ